MTSCPVILNTSFNINGEAMVETPADAIESFFFAKIDYLAIGSFLVELTDNRDILPALNRNNLIKARCDRYNLKYFMEDCFWMREVPIECELDSLRYQVENLSRLLMVRNIESTTTREALKTVPENMLQKWFGGVWRRIKLY